jgi:hypothetical protein
MMDGLKQQASGERYESASRMMGTEFQRKMPNGFSLRRLPQSRIDRAWGSSSPEVSRDKQGATCGAMLVQMVGVRCLPQFCRHGGRHEKAPGEETDDTPCRG